MSTLTHMHIAVNLGTLSRDQGRRVDKNGQGCQ